MTLEVALTQRLMADATLFAAVGSRVEWGELTQGSPSPNLLLTLVSDGRPRTYRGFQKMRPSRVQVRVNGRTRAEAPSLRERVIVVLAPRYASGDVVFLPAQEIRVLPAPERSGTDSPWPQLIDMVLWHNA